MMTRRRIARIVWGFSRWAWTNRKNVAWFEMTMIRDGQEVPDYFRMLQRASANLGARGLETTIECHIAPGVPAPPDIDQAWSDLQRREGEAGPS